MTTSIANVRSEQRAGKQSACEVRVLPAGLVRGACAPLSATWTRSAEGDHGQLTVTGYAAVFDSPTLLWSYGDTEEYEVVRAGAFARALREKQDVAAVIEHDWSRIIARTPGTLSLIEDATGLLVRATPPRTQEAIDLAANIESGNIRGMSFRFVPVSTRETMKQQQRNGRIVRVVTRELLDLNISDVSWCVWPAYPATSAGVGRAAGNADGASAGGEGGQSTWGRSLVERLRRAEDARRRVRLMQRGASSII